MAVVQTDSSPEIGPPHFASLGEYRDGGYKPGRQALVRSLWYFLSLVVFESGWFPVYGLKRWLLRCFGAEIGRRVVIKPHVRIKYPWHLRVGNDSWIGEEVWIDNLALVDVSGDVCLSQGVYLCTGSHDRNSVKFDLIVKPIVIEAQAWVAARAVVLPGVTIGRGAVIAAGSVVTKDILPGLVVGGSPIRTIDQRIRSN